MEIILKKMWKKGNTEGLSYYNVINIGYKTEVYSKAEVTPEIIQDISNRRGALQNDWGHLLDVAVPGDSEEVDKDAVELPPGIYRLKAPTDNIPTRLEVMSTRDEGYIPLPDHENLVKDIGRFLKAEEMYKKLQFIYKRGYLLYGEPGTGKTAFIRYICNLDVFKDARIIWMTFVPPSGMIEALNAIPGLKVLIMEEMLQESGRLNYDMQRLLEFMDGENSVKNSITIGTTNYPQFLHKNLADRPSRFDVLFEMKQQPVQVLKKILEEWLEREVKENEIDYSKLSLAHLKEIVLLSKFYDISLNDAAERLKAQSKKFEKGFETKGAIGFGIGGEHD